MTNLKKFHVCLSRLNSMAATGVLILLLMMLFANARQSTAHAGAPAATARQSSGGTIVDEDILTDTTWTQAGSPYTVTKAAFLVAADATLTIAPAVEVIMADDLPYNARVRFRIEGAVVAEGTQDQPILITSANKTAGSWLGIEAGNTEADPATITFTHVTVEYGETTADANLTLGLPGWATAEIRHSTFRHSSGAGIYAFLPRTNLHVADSHFIENGLEAISLKGDSTGSGRSTDPVLRNLAASGNGVNAVKLEDLFIAGEHTLEAMGLPYIVTDLGIRLVENGVLTIEPGVALRFDGSRLDVDEEGTLIAVGTANAPITFTGVDKLPGAWRGLDVLGSFRETASATLSHVIIEYGGEHDPDHNFANLRVGNATVTVTDSIIRHGGNHGVSVDGGLVISDTTITGNALYPVLQEGGVFDPVLANVQLSGNGTDAIALGNGGFGVNLEGTHHWENVGLPYELLWGATVDGFLTLEPGVDVRAAEGVGLQVDRAGVLVAQGTADAPITFTGTFTGSTQQAGWWRGITGYGLLLFRHCDIGYGGYNPDQPMVSVIKGMYMESCRVHHSAADAIELRSGATTFFRNNRIEENAFGLRNSTVANDPGLVDARHTWWGHASGPSHATNGDGQGNAVSDYVLFEPWLTAPGGTVVSGDELSVEVLGGNHFFPGSTQPYAVAYNNPTTETVDDAVLVVTLPADAAYVDNSGDGVFWPQRKQLFWKLDELAPGARGVVAFHVRFYGGIPDGTREAVYAQLGGSSLAGASFDVQPYLAYVAPTVLSEEPLTAAEVQAERQRYPQLDQLYTQATAEGFQFGAARRLSFQHAEPMTQIVLLRTGPAFEVMYLQRQGDQALALVVDRSTLRLHTVTGTIQLNTQMGAWVKGAAGMSRLSAQGIDWGDCMINCIAEQFPMYVASQLFKSVSAMATAATCVQAAGGDELAIANCANDILVKVPGWSEGVALGQCNADCSQCSGSCDDPNCHCCTADKRVCEYGGLYGFFGIDSITTYACDPTLGTYSAGRTTTVCATCERCIPGVAGPTCQAPATASSLQRLATLLTGQNDRTGGEPSNQPGTPRSPLAELALAASAGSGGICPECIGVGDHCIDQDLNGVCDSQERVYRAVLARVGANDVTRDALDKGGPEGDVIPGQQLTYAISLQNTSSNRLQNLLVIDELSEHVDPATVVVHAEDTYTEEGNRLIWWIEELAPAGQPGSTAVLSFTVRLKTNLPGGTVVVNRATIAGPGGAEETTSDAIVSVVQPLAAMPNTLITEAGQPVAIELAGHSPAGEPLNYAVVETPIYGGLSGTPPALHYTPAPNFAGTDQLRFTVSNGETTSRAASVEIIVEPSPNDATPPQVLWTAPAAGETVAGFGDEARFAGRDGFFYAPAIQVRFSEAISRTTLTAATVRLMDDAGQLVPASVSFDHLLNEALILPQEALQERTEYTVVLTGGVTDLAGNPLPSEYSWQFHTAGAASSARQIHLPFVTR